MEGNEKASEEQLKDVPAAALAEAERPLIGTVEENGVIDPDVLWSCTTCGACVEQCPVDIEHIDHIVDMRRYQVMIESAFPSEAGTMLKNLEKKGNPWGLAKKQRVEWTKEVDFEVPIVGKDVEDLSEIDYLYWVGCAGALEDRAKKTTKAFAELLHIAGVKFAIMGGDEKCTGDSARRLGNEPLFQQLGQENVAMLNMAFGEDDEDETTKKPKSSKKIVATCPHCFNTIANEYPQLGGEYEVIHHTQLLQHLVDEGKLIPVTPVEGLITYHDPCYLGLRQQDLHAAARDHREGAGSAERGDAPPQGARLLLRRRWCPDVDGGADRQAHQQRARRRSPLPQPGHRLHRLPVLPRHADRLGQRQEERRQGEGVGPGGRRLAAAARLGEDPGGPGGRAGVRECAGAGAGEVAFGRRRG